MRSHGSHNRHTPNEGNRDFLTDSGGFDERAKMGAKGLNSPAGPVLTSDWTDLREAVYTSPRPVG